MGHVPRILACLMILAALANARAVAFDGPTQTTSPSKKAPGAGSSVKKAKPAPSQQEQAAAAATKALDEGCKAFKAGKSERAVRLLNTALRSGGLKTQQVAEALYYRGLGYRKLGKPGQAISDLTSAAWVKGALTPTQKADALKNRNAAYREAGIDNPPAASESAGVSVAASAPPAGDSDGWDTALSGPTASPAKPVAPRVASAPTSAPPTPTAVPATSTVATKSSSGGGIGGFFSNITNIFSGSSSEKPVQQSAPPATTATINAPAAETSSWSGNTQVAAVSPAPSTPAEVTTPFQTQVAAVKPAAGTTKNQAARAPSGKYRLQVGAVRSRTEADALAARLVQKHRSQIGSRQPVIDEAVIGSMGTFYRVRLGPYASAKEPQQLCGSLRTSGFDCLVVTQ